MKINGYVDPINEITNKIQEDLTKQINDSIIERMINVCCNNSGLRGKTCILSDIDAMLIV